MDCMTIICVLTMALTAVSMEITPCDPAGAKEYARSRPVTVAISERLCARNKHGALVKSWRRAEG